MKHSMPHWNCLTTGAILLLAIMPSRAGSSQTPTAVSSAKPPSSADTAEKKTRIEGTIARIERDSFVLKDASGAETVVSVTNKTRFKEMKTNPFRGAREYTLSQLPRGLYVQIDGRSAAPARIVADLVRLREGDRRTAGTLTSVVAPIEARLDQTENRLLQAEKSAQRLSGQVDELGAVANAAKDAAKQAGDSVDRYAERDAEVNNRLTAGIKNANDRISTLDEYDVKKTVTVYFKVGDAKISDQAKASLDGFAEAAKAEKAYIVEIAGFASADGDKSANMLLSQRRADAVVRYLSESHSIPQRRLVTPLGFGPARPTADNKTHEGRVQNRRVELKLLVNKSLGASSDQVVSPKPE